MSIQVIQEDAETYFINLLETSVKKSPLGQPMLFCAFSAASIHPDSNEILALMSFILNEYEAGIYCCKDGDILISWKGKIGEVSEAITTTLCSYYQRQLENRDIKTIFTLFDSKVHAETLQQLFCRKIDALLESQQLSKSPRQSVQLLYEMQQELFLRSLIARKSRELPIILLVEDQSFSRKLMLNMLEKHYQCLEAKNAAEAINAYALHAPDITFLDVELPDSNGHQLAALFRQHDPDAFIAMVTSNHYLQDVQMAKKNKVQGFIAKPYNRQRIFGFIDTYRNLKKT